DLASLIGWYWITRATSEGIRWLDELFACEPDDSPPNALACFMRGFLSVLQSYPAAATRALERAATTAQHEGWISLRSQALSMASIARHLGGDRTSATRLLATAQRIPTGPDDFPATIALLQARALLGLFEGDLDAVSSASSDGVRLSREAGDLYSLEMMLLNLGCTALIGGDHDGAKPLFTEALRIARQLDDRVAEYCRLDALGRHAARRGEPRPAARLAGA